MTRLNRWTQASAIIGLIAVCPGIALAQDQAIEWGTQVATLSGDGGEAFIISARDKYSCELSFSQNGSKTDFTVYQVPETPPSLFVYAPAEWLDIAAGEKRLYSIITVKPAVEGEAKLGAISMPFSVVNVPETGPSLSARPSGLTGANLAGTSYLSFAAAPDENQPARSKDDPGPMLEYQYHPALSTTAAAYFGKCHDWIRQQPQWQATFGPG